MPPLELGLGLRLTEGNQKETRSTLTLTLTCYLNLGLPFIGFPTSLDEAQAIYALIITQNINYLYKMYIINKNN